MFNVFSSDHRPLYKMNVLESLAYPPGHRFLYRYQKQHVHRDLVFDNTEKEAEEIKKIISLNNPVGVAWYAETDRSTGHFNFYPLRKIEVLNIRREGTIFYTEARLLDFIDYGDKGDDILDQWRHFIEEQPYYPLPPPNHCEQKFTWRDGKKVPYSHDLTETTQGYFLSLTSGDLPEIPGLAANQDQILAWEHLADRLTRARSLMLALPYTVKGIYSIKKPLWRAAKERELKPKDDGLKKIYPLPMGGRIVLKLLFYRSSNAPSLPLQRLRIDAPQEAFAGVWPREIRIASRYDEQSIEIVCKRVFDSVLAPIQIDLVVDDEPTEILCAPMSLDTYLRVPKRILGAILFGLAVGPLLISIGPDLVDFIADWWLQYAEDSKDIKEFVNNHTRSIVAICKLAGTTVALLSGFYAFRRLPLGK